MSISVNPPVQSTGQLGDFVIAGVLGEGGSGVVLDARWGHREVALKVLHPTLVATAREREQFLAEARRLQEISHPGVVKVFAVGELPDGRPYLAMEKLAGSTLAARLASSPLSSGLALSIFGQLAGAVAALHDQGLVHRDLKPENVMLVGGDAHAVLLDFGIAKEVGAPASTTTQDGGVRGTPAYMAPERFFGQPASVATDVYELAVTLYAMLAGRLPWDDCGDPEVRLDPMTLRDAGIDAPEALDVEVRRALSTRAQNRPATMRDFAAAILGDAAATEAPRTTTQVPSSSRSPAWFQKHPTPGGSDKGQTPLAWAPTVRGEAASQKIGVLRRRWPYVAAAAVAVAAAIVGWVVLRSGDDGEQAAVAASDAAEVAVVDEGDPWARSAAARIDDAAQSTAGRRAAMIGAVGKLPAATRIVAAVSLRELRESRDLGGIIDVIAKRPEAQVMFGDLKDCPIGIEDIDWAVIGFTDDDRDDGEVILSGGWDRDDIDQCLASVAGGDAKRTTAANGIEVTEVKGKAATFRLAVDGTTTLISTRDAPIDHVAGLIARTEGPAGDTAKLIGELDRDASFWIAIDVDANDRIDVFESFSKGGDLFGWARIEGDDGGLAAMMAGRFRKPADADKMQRAAEAELAEITGDEKSSLIGEFAVRRDGNDVRVDAKVTPLALGLASGMVDKMFE